MAVEAVVRDLLLVVLMPMRAMARVRGLRLGHPVVDEGYLRQEGKQQQQRRRGELNARDEPVNNHSLSRLRTVDGPEFR